MKKLFLIFLLLFLTVSAFAQIETNTTPIGFGGTLPATCTPSTKTKVLFYKTGSSNGLYQCLTTNTWTTAGGSSGANTALSNLASVSINAGLIPQTTVDLGAAATPFRSLYLYGAGTFGSHSIKFTGTPTGNRVLTFPDVTDTVAVLGTAQTFTAAQTFTPPANTTGIVGSGFSLTGANAQSMLSLNGTLNTSGSPDLISLDFTNTTSGASTNLINLKTAGASKFSVDKGGALTSAGNIFSNGGSLISSPTGSIYFNSRSVLTSPSDGNLRLTNFAQNDFSLLQFGGTTSSFPALKRSTTGLQVKLADDSAFASITIAGLGTNNGTSNNTFDSTAIGLNANSALLFSNSTTNGAGTKDTGLSRSAAGIVKVTDGSSGFGTLSTGGLNFNRAIVAGGTTGAQTINLPNGRVNVATGANSLVVTNSLVTATSGIIAVANANDTTCSVKNAVPTAGSFTINMTANCTAETAVTFWVTN